MEVFKTSKNVSGVQPKILDYKNKEYFEYADIIGDVDPIKAG